MLLPRLQDEIAAFVETVRTRPDAMADRVPLEDVLRGRAEIDVPLMAVAVATGMGLPDGAPFDRERF